jgi:hypothetical protein
MLGLHSKVQNPAIAGAIVVILAWCAKTFGHQEIPPEVASAVTLLVMAVTGYTSDGSASPP